ncbi:MAG: hypothetical protein KKD90_01570, partial [Candidatus Omnitrophica bacterium]|nr:hypothetical protein [Candidatus Omnitrophota bacterium]
MQKVISRENLYSKVAELLKDFEVIGSKELSNKGIFYQVTEDAKELYLGQDFAIEPIKKFFLEPSSWILRHAKDDVSVESFPQSDKKRIVIGARPCEVRGLTLLDKLFDSEYKDDFYINNRKRTIIVGLACGKPDKSCFCTSMQGSPAGFSGMDALLFESDDGFVIELITDKGKHIFGSIG